MDEVHWAVTLFPYESRSGDVALNSHREGRKSDDMTPCQRSVPQSRPSLSSALLSSITAERARPGRDKIWENAIVASRKVVGGVGQMPPTEETQVRMAIDPKAARRSKKVTPHSSSALEAPCEDLHSSMANGRDRGHSCKCNNTTNRIRTEMLCDLSARIIFREFT